MANLGAQVNSDDYWDDIYLEEWDSAKRIWPTKNALIEEKTNVSDKILDVACGTGSILRHLKTRGYEHLYGTEISNICVKRLTACDIGMVKSVLPKIEYNDNMFDVVIASQILEHIIDRHAFLQEIHRILKPGGCCFLFVPNDCLGPIDEPSHVVKFTGKSLDKELRMLISRYLFSMPI